MTYLADADWVIDYLSGRADAHVLFPTLISGGLAISVMSRIELWTGVAGSRDPVQAARDLRRFLRAVTIIPFNLRVQQATIQVRRQLLDQRLPIKHRAYDLIVAATALAYDLMLVTSNTRDYRDIPNLKRLNPRTGETTAPPPAYPEPES
jgi:tRNA(fMet)-specific endonuclease VapC